MSMVWFSHRSVRERCLLPLKALFGVKDVVAGPTQRSADTATPWGNVGGLKAE